MTVDGAGKDQGVPHVNARLGRLSRPSLTHLDNAPVHDEDLSALCLPAALDDSPDDREIHSRHLSAGPCSP